MKFVFDLDGTLSFDYMTIDEEIKQVLLKAEDYGHELVFASARSYRDCLGLLGPELSQRLVIGLNGGVAYHLGKAVFERNLDARVYQALVDYCQTYNLLSLQMIALTTVVRLWKKFHLSLVWIP